MEATQTIPQAKMPGRAEMRNHPATVPELKIKFSMFTKALDLTPIKFKLIKEQDWSLERAEMVEAQYKAFLFLLGTKDGRFFIPTLDIDEMWHTHILDTRKYMDDCANLFGEYIHHYPYLGMKDGDDKIRAQKLFAKTCEQLLAELDIDVRNLKFSCCGGGSCGGGSSCSGGGSSCGGHGGGDGGSGGHGGDTGGGHGHGDHYDSGYVPGIVSCGGGTASINRRRSPGNSRRPSYSPPGRPSQPEQKRRGILRRILGLSPAATETWYRSVTPQFFNRNEYRPDEEALQKLAAGKKRQYH